MIPKLILVLTLSKEVEVTPAKKNPTKYEKKLNATFKVGYKPKIMNNVKLKKRKILKVFFTERIICSMCFSSS